MTISIENLWDTARASQFFGLTRATITAWIRRGDLAAANFGTPERPIYRIDPADARDLHERRKLKQQPTPLRRTTRLVEAVPDHLGLGA
jgi:hypothetical protein